MRPRPLVALSKAAADYPGAWRLYDGFRAERGRKVPDWPGWCFAPLAVAYAVASQGHSRARALTAEGMRAAEDVARIGALAAWRPTQGIYRFAPEVFAALAATSLEGDLPADVLYTLPEWCVYVEAQDMSLDGEPIWGWWAHLENDANTGVVELRLLLDLDSGLLGIPLELGQGGIVGALAALEAEAHRRAPLGMAVPRSTPEIRGILAEMVSSLVSVTLYLCSGSTDLVDPKRPGAQPAEPKAKRTKKGPRLFPPKAPTVWRAGFTLAQSLRAASVSEGEGAHVRAHVRRAHWHTIWTGPKDRPELRRRELRWFHPILVGGGPDRPTVKTVE